MLFCLVILRCFENLHFPLISAVHIEETGLRRLQELWQVATDFHKTRAN